VKHNCVLLRGSSLERGTGAGDIKSAVAERMPSMPGGCWVWSPALQKKKNKPKTTNKQEGCCNTPPDSWIIWLSKSKQTDDHNLRTGSNFTTRQMLFGVCHQSTHFGKTLLKSYVNQSGDVLTPATPGSFEFSYYLNGYSSKCAKALTLPRSQQSKL
jgi:hypothetical protein